jgi:hypothetical protein
MLLEGNCATKPCLSKKTNGWLEPGLQATTIGSQIIYHAIALGELPGRVSTIYCKFVTPHP